jgi:hypothetical protein
MGRACNNIGGEEENVQRFDGKTKRKETTRKTQM